MKLDLHLHTNFSKDGSMSLQLLSKLCIKHNLNIAITDHNTIRGALQFKKQFPEIKCIIGEEISTKEGEIIGLFLNSEISPYLSIEETIGKILRQDGLIYIPHPFDMMREGRIERLDWIESLPQSTLKNIIVEVFNSRCIFKKYNALAKTFAEKHNLLLSCGSDAHIKQEFGKTFININEFNTKEGFIKNLKSAELHCKYSPLAVHIFSKLNKLNIGKKWGFW